MGDYVSVWHTVKTIDGLWRNRADIKLVMLTESTVAEGGTFWAKAELLRGEGKI